MNEEMKRVVESARYATLVTMNPDGTPHPIIVGGVHVEGDNIALGIYRMERTQQNLAQRADAWVAIAATDDGPKGYRFAGTAVPAADGKKVVFVIRQAEALI